MTYRIYQVTNYRCPLSLLAPPCHVMYHVSFGIHVADYNVPTSLSHMPVPCKARKPWRAATEIVLLHRHRCEY